MTKGSIALVRLWRHAFFTVACLSFAALQDAHAQVVTFADETFTDGDWAISELRDTTANNSFTFSAKQELANGNPGAYRFVTNALNTDSAGPGATILSAHVYQPGTYDPAVSGGIESIQFTMDGIGLTGPAGAKGFGFAIEQNGKIFSRATQQVLNGAGWQPRDSGVITDLADFQAEDGTTLDLSTDAAPLKFGFYTGNGTRGDSTNTGGVDNWVVTITPEGLVIIRPAPPSVGAAVENGQIAAQDANNAAMDRMNQSAGPLGCPSSSPGAAFGAAPLRLALAGGPRHDTPIPLFRASSCARPAMPLASRRKWTVYGTTRYGFGDRDGSISQAGFDAHAVSGTVGMDRFVTPTVMVGVAGGYTSVDSDLDRSLGSVDTNAYSVTGYAGMIIGPAAFANAAVTYSRNSTDQNRLGASGTGRVTSETDGRALAVSLLTGIDLPFRSLTVGASVGTQFIRTRTDAYTESAATMTDAFRVPEVTENSVQSTMAVRLSRTFQQSWGAITPMVSAAWVHDFMDDGQSVRTIADQGTGPSVTTRLAGSDSDFGTLGFQLNSVIGSRTIVGAGLSRDVARDDGSWTTASLRMRVRF